MKKILIIGSCSFLFLILLVLSPFLMLSGGSGFSFNSDDSNKENSDQDFIQSSYGYINPLDTIRITNDWLEYSAIKEFDAHPAVDLACSLGEPIKAADNGVVFQAGYGWDLYGAMTLWFRSETDPTITMQYAHISKVYVSKGERIKKGQVIAACGMTGIATGTHLHLQVNKQNNIVNPHIYFDF